MVTAPPQTVSPVPTANAVSRVSLMVIPHYVPLVVEEARPGTVGTNQGPANPQMASRVPKELQFDPGTDGDFGLSEPQAVAHFTKLSQKNFGNDTALYPLGSCTMKHNPKACDELAGLSTVNLVHPAQDPRTIQGSLECFFELERWLAEVTGMDAVSLQPAAGSQGEFLGLLTIRAYHQSKGQGHRDEVILPDTAHGTNPATASMAGYKVVEIPSGPDGLVDLEALRAAVSDKTAAFMLTNPNTLGIFEGNIQEVQKVIHDAGGLLYYDGANLYAITGQVRPGDMGFDVVHINLHKTFAVPHGGGGPGSGPIGVKKRLEPFLPVPRVVKKSDGTFDVEGMEKHPQSVGKIKAGYGQGAALIRAYSYMLLLGGEGITRASEIACLNANYVKAKLAGVLDFPHPGRSMHEFVASASGLKKRTTITAGDLGKRLLDCGLHAPTVYFPLLVPEAIMFEPTESATKAELDRFIDAVKAIAEEDPAIVHGAPHTTPVRRLDEATAAKKLVLRWHTLARLEDAPKAKHDSHTTTPTGA
ncbi:MAG TPA: aminomethyl-transferring glycine dehydrogenase subunit GcvPB [Candidatus Thermoplasmatota archaeon]|nr:aminomethyl-transferring glycine dehydrogenase subunit GcvPB [Candidatus Thermoplasmatota archaeon]